MDLVRRVSSVHRKMKLHLTVSIRKINQNKNTRDIAEDMINCQVTDTDKFNALGMTLYVFLRETGVRGRRKAGCSSFLYGTLCCSNCYNKQVLILFCMR